MKKRLPEWLLMAFIVFGIPSLAICVCLFFNGIPVVEGAIVVLLVAGIGCSICASISRMNCKRARFEGQVSGFISALVVSGMIYDSTGHKIASLAQKELANLYAMKGKPPEKEDCPFYYVQDNCAGFALLCIKKYAEEARDISEAKASELLHFCEEHTNAASRLYAYYRDW